MELYAVLDFHSRNTCIARIFHEQEGKWLQIFLTWVFLLRLQNFANQITKGRLYRFIIISIEMLVAAAHNETVNLSSAREESGTISSDLM